MQQHFIIPVLLVDSGVCRVLRQILKDKINREDIIISQNNNQFYFELNFVGEI